MWLQCTPSFIEEDRPLSFLRPFSRFRAGLWFIPLMCVMAGVALSFGTIAIDRAFNYDLVPKSISGGPDAAIEILGTVAASMVNAAEAACLIAVQAQCRDALAVQIAA